MNVFEKHLTEVKEVTSRSHIEAMVNEVILTDSEMIIRDVRERWIHGDGVEGGVIGIYRSKDYELFKASINPLAGGAVDLILTGKLAGGLAIRKQGDLYQIYSTDSKYEAIGKKYGFEEYGLTKEQLDAFYERVYAIVLGELLTKLWK